MPEEEPPAGEDQRLLSIPAEDGEYFEVYANELPALCERYPDIEDLPGRLAELADYHKERSSAYATAQEAGACVHQWLSRANEFEKPNPRTHRATAARR